ncbi:hypothetical protein BKK47_11415 [Rodentibacter mrazii]|uniref:Uncharacterized protein n=1 Tax=Rodentibacter mrazii TaxID=1908257 RepID=A0A1V3IA67_9PAST|nr:hypothetical protein [Rodentibacter mrazii]OOF36865.1 hypothetical protein BKK47_11415 [Rodentibacter mrazii]
MTLQNPEKQAELEKLIAELNENNQAFLAVQDKALTIKSNIERNQKMVEALEQENQEAQKEIDSLQVSDTGEINFKGFDEVSERISKNTLKINALNKVITKFDAKLKLLLITEYKAFSDNSISIKTKALDLIAQEFMEEFFKSEPMKKINEIYSVLFENKSSVLFGNYINYDHKETFLNLFVGKVKSHLDEKIDISHLKINMPEIKFNIPNPGGGSWQKREYIRELEELANQ